MSRSPTTHRIYTSMFPSGADSRKHAFHRGRAKPHGSQTSCGDTVRQTRHSNETLSIVLAANPAPPRADFTPASLFLPPMAQTYGNALSTEAAQNSVAQRHRERHLATRCATDYICQSSRSPTTRRIYTNVFHFTPWHRLMQTLVQASAVCQRTSR